MSKRTQADTGGDATKPPKRPRASHAGQEDNTGNGVQRGEHVYRDRQVIDAFTRAGYTLESNDEDENGWAPLNQVKQPTTLSVGWLELMRYMQLKPTMRHAIKSNGSAVVVKMLHPYSNELEILRHLHQIDSPYNHTIPLLMTLELNMGTFVLLPEATPLDHGFALGMFRSEVVDFSQQLIEGVAFLHRLGVAHLDIKPQNIVARPNRLFIIDFDISIRVDGPNALIDRWCGTPGWMAPEIGRQDRPRCSYSPIRADLWSCGLVLRYLASNGTVKENPFKILTRQLLNKNPRLRPLLHRQSPFRVGHSLSKPQVIMKRKPDRLPHGAKRLAIDTVHP
jgi:serine/threonine protein kinase